jgi:hypothetical protein
MQKTVSEFSLSVNIPSREHPLQQRLQYWHVSALHFCVGVGSSILLWSKQNMSWEEAIGSW